MFHFRFLDSIPITNTTRVSKQRIREFISFFNHKHRHTFQLYLKIINTIDRVPCFERKLYTHLVSITSDRHYYEENSWLEGDDKMAGKTVVARHTGAYKCPWNMISIS